jgi:hypothetical protein
MYIYIRHKNADKNKSWIPSETTEATGILTAVVCIAWIM